MLTFFSPSSPSRPPKQSRNQWSKQSSCSGESRLGLHLHVRVAVSEVRDCLLFLVIPRFQLHETRFTQPCSHSAPKTAQVPSVLGTESESQRQEHPSMDSSGEWRPLPSGRFRAGWCLPLTAVRLFPHEEERLTPACVAIRGQGCMGGMRGTHKVGLNGRGL